MFKALLFLMFVVFSANAALIGTNVSQRDLKVLDDLDIDPAFITDYQLQKTYNRLVYGWQSSYVRKLNNATLFVPTVKNILREEGIPDTFLYMAMAESYFTVDARSHVKATGMWQFMSATAKMYGLKNDVYVDERMDVVKSTRAAAKFLKYLHKRFDSWHLAAIAYNCGPGRVIEAKTRAMLDMYEEKYGKNNPRKSEIRSYRSTIRGYQQRRVKFSHVNKIYKKVSTWGFEPDLYKLLTVQKKVKRQYLPKESRLYIRKIIALAMMNNHNFMQEGDNTHLLNLGMMPMAIATVDVKGGLHLKNIAQAIGMKHKELKAINKHIKRDIIPNYNKSYPIYIPYSRLSRYQMNKDQIKETRFAIHTVQKGDNLSRIGRKYGISYKLIKSYNKLKSNRLSLRQKLVIPFRLARS